MLDTCLVLDASLFILGTMNIIVAPCECGKWSLANTDHPMTEEQLAARQHILEHEELPPQYDLFLFNGSCETSINIRGHIDYFIAHTANPTSLT